MHFFCKMGITIKRNKNPLRVYLKTGNMTNSEGFFAC